LESCFDLKLLDIYWIENLDEPYDLCAHGHVLVQIGTEIVSDQNSLNVTVSATALYLMRTLTSNYQEGDYFSQLLPCCGHFLMVDEAEEKVVICGCPSGIDWTITHKEDGTIAHRSNNGQVAIISKDAYQKLVFEFADQVEQFYQSSSPKILPTDDYDQQAYRLFWNEWRQLRGPSKG
jgi:hypothetical protein